MSKAIEDKNKVSEDRIRLYQEIDGLKVIEDLLLFKGVQVCHERGLGYAVSRKHLDDMALVSYGLTVNSTNKLYVTFHLDKFYRRADLVDEKHTTEVIVPKYIYEGVKTLNDRYKTKDNQLEE